MISSWFLSGFITWFPRPVPALPRRFGLFHFHRELPGNESTIRNLSMLARENFRFSEFSQSFNIGYCFHFGYLHRSRLHPHFLFDPSQQESPPTPKSKRGLRVHFLFREPVLRFSSGGLSDLASDPPARLGATCGRSRQRVPIAPT